MTCLCVRVGDLFVCARGVTCERAERGLNTWQKRTHAVLVGSGDLQDAHADLRGLVDDGSVGGGAEQGSELVAHHLDVHRGRGCLRGVGRVGHLDPQLWPAEREHEMDIGALAVSVG